MFLWPILVDLGTRDRVLCFQIKSFMFQGIEVGVVSPLQYIWCGWYGYFKSLDLTVGLVI